MFTVSSSSADPRSGLVFNIHELGRRVGSMREIRETASAGEGIGIDVIGVPTGSDIDLDLRFQSVMEGVLVTGVAELLLRGECVRCLETFESIDSFDIQELFLYPDKELDDDEACRVEGELIDLEPVLRDSVVLDLPFAPLCRPDCAGLCVECGANLNQNPEHGHDEATDPRWSGLSGWATEDHNQ